jgi:hypothetical protein
MSQETVEVGSDTRLHTLTLAIKNHCSTALRKNASRQPRAILESPPMPEDSVRAGPEYAKTIDELRGLDEKTLIEQHDKLVRGGIRVQQGYYRDELRRREADSRERKMVNLTWVILGLTCVNVVVLLVAELG